MPGAGVGGGGTGGTTTLTFRVATVPGAQVPPPASSQTSSTLGAYRVNTATGKLVRIGTYATEKQPRGFNIDPSGRYLLAVGQLSPTLSLYRIDAKTGGLATLGQYPVGKGANWVELVNFDGSNR